MKRTLHVRLLGPVAATVDGADSDLGSPRQRALFATLAARPNQRIRRADLIDAVWGAEAPATAANSIHTYVNRLRRQLEPHRQCRAPSRVLLSEGSSYALLLDPRQVDTCSFVEHLQRARQQREAGAVGCAVAELSKGLALWRGVALDGTHGPFIEIERVRLDELRLSALEDRAEMLLELGRQVEAVGELLPMVRLHPFRERMRHLLVLGYVQMGSRAEALAEIRDLRETLVTELGLEPPEAVQRLQEQILCGEPYPVVAWGGGPEATVEPIRLSTVPTLPQPPPTVVAAAPTAQPTLAMNPAQLPRDVPGFIGRDAELATLHAMVSEADAAGTAPAILIGGAPGVGKTALAVHFAHQVADRYPDGQLHLDLRGFALDPEPMSSTEALGHLLAGLGVQHALPAGVDRQGGLYRSLLSDRRMVLLLDNARSIEQVRPLLPASRSCLVLVTSRNRLSGLTARDGARRMDLGLMRDDYLLHLFRSGVGDAVPECRALLRTILASCGRLPLALRIAAERISTAQLPSAVFEELRSAGDLLDLLEIPGDPHSSMRELLHWSYRTLHSDAAATFDALGRHGDSTFTLATAAALTGADNRQTWRSLAMLVDAYMVQQLERNLFELNTLVRAYAVERAHATAA